MDLCPCTQKLRSECWAGLPARLFQNGRRQRCTTILPSAACRPRWGKSALVATLTLDGPCDAGRRPAAYRADHWTNGRLDACQPALLAFLVSGILLVFGLLIRMGVPETHDFIEANKTVDRLDHCPWPGTDDFSLPVPDLPLRICSGCLLGPRVPD